MEKKCTKHLNVPIDLINSISHLPWNYKYIGNINNSENLWATFLDVLVFSCFKIYKPRGGVKLMKLRYSLQMKNFASNFLPILLFILLHDCTELGCAKSSATVIKTTILATRSCRSIQAIFTSYTTTYVSTFPIFL